MLQSSSAVPQAGDAVILYQGYGNISPLTLEAGAVYHCKSGKYNHSDIIGKPLGRYVAGRSNRLNDPTTPHLLVLPLSATLWTQAVPHRTQIIYDTDIAVITLQLRLGPGKRVLEAGTGSGSLTHSMARTVAPHGIVFTCDFHKGRCLQAREEFRQHFGRTTTLVSSHWRDVCTTCTDVEVRIDDIPGGDAAVGGGTPERVVITDTNDLTLQESPRPGFGLPQHSVDAVFLDVPAPWLAVENVLHVLKPGGMLATFSPCIEQTQRLCQQLREPPHEFVDIRTVEALTKFFEPGPSARTPRKRQRDDETSPGVGADDGLAVLSASEATKGYSKLRPCPVSKGHSAYLTFARRRLPPNSAAEDDEEDTRSLT